MSLAAQIISHDDSAAHFYKYTLYLCESPIV